jgi:hypothetical protein
MTDLSSSRDIELCRFTHQTRAVANPAGKASPVQEDKYESVSSAAAPRVEGDDISFDINEWTPGKVHEVRSPAEFKA